MLKFPVAEYFLKIVSGTEEELKSISVFDLTRKCRHRFFKPGKVISKDVVFGDRSPVPITDDMWPSYFIERETRKEINLFYFCPDVINSITFVYILFVNVYFKLGHDHPTVEKKVLQPKLFFKHRFAVSNALIIMLRIPMKNMNQLFSMTIVMSMS